MKDKWNKIAGVLLLADRVVIKQIVTSRNKVLTCGCVCVSGGSESLLR